MGFLSKKNIRKATHIGVKSQNKIAHVGKKVVKEAPEALVRTGQTLTDIGKIGEDVGQVAMAINPELGGAILEGSKSLERGASVLKSSGRTLKKARRGDIKGAVKQGKETARATQGETIDLGRKSKSKKPSVQKETMPETSTSMVQFSQPRSTSRMSYENFA